MKKITVTDDLGIQHTVKDLTGQKFNKLTVTGINGIQNSGFSTYKVYWNCKCDCGNTTRVRADQLTGGSVKSCGCSKIRDLTGMKFGYLSPIKVHGVINGVVRWLCKCDCGKEHVVAAGDLIKGSTKSCGCKRIQLNSEYHLLDLTGQRFGRLVAIKRTRIDKNGTHWLCKCDCGKEVECLLGNLRSGSAQSCGCRQRELTSIRNKFLNTEYASDEERRIAAIMGHMRQRCYNPKCDRYPDWGGRGIKICDEWLSDTKKFVRWSLRNGYKSGYTINRKDNDGNYCPENCNWIPRAEQSRNTRKTRRIIVGDVTDLVLEDWRKLIPKFSTWVGYRYSSDTREVGADGNLKPAFTNEEAAAEIGFILDDFAKVRGMSISTTPVSEILKLYIKHKQDT